jgi:hypothetical protein
MDALFSYAESWGMNTFDFAQRLKHEPPYFFDEEYILLASSPQVIYL